MMKTAADITDPAFPTIGFLSRAFRGYLASFSLWYGLDEAAREEGVNLISFPGNPPRSNYGSEAQANSVYDLISRPRIDGLVIWGGVMIGHSPPEVLSDFYRRFASFPCLSIGPPVAGVSSLGVDNYRGMYDACAHLIERHGRRRIAFVRGPVLSAEAESRFRAYRDALADRGLPFDPALVAEGDFLRESGRQAVRTFLDERHAAFDALAVANDLMALGAMDELAARGRRVPDDAAVVGFDDIEEGRYGKVPLATVRQPFYEMGRRAIRRIKALVQGGEGNEDVLLPAKFFPRLSCGCRVDEPAAPGTGHLPPDVVRAAALGSLGKDDVAEALIAHTPCGGLLNWTTIATVAAGFLEEFQSGREGAFGAALVRELLTVEDYAQVTAYQDLLAGIQAVFSGGPESAGADRGRMQALLKQGRLIIAEYAQRQAASQGYLRDNLNRYLRTIGQRLMSRFEMSGFLDALAEGLALLRVPACFLSLYEDPGERRRARLVLAYAGHRPIALDPQGRSFDAADIVPSGMLPRSRPLVMIVEPVYLESETMGFIAYEEGPRESGVYNALTQHVSSALLGVRHAAALESATRALERSNRELERSNRELEQFAFIASHDLQEPLRKIAMFAERLETLSEPLSGHTGRDYIARIRSGTRRMKTLIDDLLVFSRTTVPARPPEPVDLDVLVREIINDLEIRIRETAARVEAGPLPSLEGDRSRLYQLFLNLIDNALKFRLPDRPPVVDITAVEAAWHGESACAITVEDNGIGIDRKYFDKIFQIFQRLHGSDEYQGNGIGLSVCQKVVNQHGGEIRVESEPGRGSKFTVTLPLKQKPPADPPRY